jgi:hypothetical protein
MGISDIRVDLQRRELRDRDLPIAPKSEKRVLNVHGSGDGTNNSKGPRIRWQSA